MLLYLLLAMIFSLFSFGNIPPNTYTYNSKNQLTGRKGRKGSGEI